MLKKTALFLRDGFPYGDDNSTQALSTCMEPSSKRDFEEQRHENPCW